MAQIKTVRLNGGEIEERHSVQPSSDGNLTVGLRTCMNFMPQGKSLYLRPGFEFKHLHEDGGLGTVPRFILRSIDVGDDSYIAMIGDGFIKILDNEGQWIRRGSEDTHDWEHADFTASSFADTWYVTPPTDLANTNYPYRIYVDGVEMEFVPSSGTDTGEGLTNPQWTITNRNPDGSLLPSARIVMNFGGTPTTVTFDYRVWLYTDFTEDKLRELDDDDSGFTKIITHKSWNHVALVRTSENDYDWFLGVVDHDVASEDPGVRVGDLRDLTSLAGHTLGATYYRYGVSYIDNDGIEGPVETIDGGFGANLPPATTDPGFVIYFTNNDDSGPDVRPAEDNDPDQWVIPVTAPGTGYKWVSMASLGATGSSDGGVSVNDLWILLREDSIESFVDLGVREPWQEPMVIAGSPPDTIRNQSRVMVGEIGAGETVTNLFGNREYPDAAVVAWNPGSYVFGQGHELSTDGVGTLALAPDPDFWKSHFRDQMVLIVNTDTLANADPNMVECRFDFPKHSGWRVYRRVGVDTGPSPGEYVDRVLWSDWGLLAAGIAYNDIENYIAITDAANNYADYPFAGVDSTIQPFFPPTDDLVVEDRYPHRVAVHAERLHLAGSVEHPTRWRAGRRGSLLDFSLTSSTTDALRPFVRQLATETPIEFLVGDVDLIAFTSKEYFRMWSATGLIADDTVTIDRNAGIGCLPNCKPVQVDQSFVFVDAEGDDCYVLAFEGEAGRRRYTAIPLTRKAPHIFRRQTPYEGAYAAGPHPYVCYVGDLLYEAPVLTIDDDDGSPAWSRMQLYPDDEMFTVTSVRDSSGKSALFAGVMRYNADFGEILTVEKLSRYNAQGRFDCYADGFVSFGSPPGVITNVSYAGTGNAVRLRVPDFPISPPGTVFRCHIIKCKVVDPSTGDVLFEANNFDCFAKAVPLTQEWALHEDAGGTIRIGADTTASFSVANDLAFSAGDANGSYEFDWEAGLVVETYTGLDHLEGKTVWVFNNGKHVGTGVVSGGELDAVGDVDVADSYPIWGYVGIPYLAEFETYDMSSTIPGVHGTKKDTERVKVGVVDTPSVQLAVSGSRLTRQVLRRRTEVASLAVQDRVDYIDVNPSTDTSSDVSVRVHRSLTDTGPIKVVSIAPDVEVVE